LTLSFCAGEAIIRFKNRSMTNYDIEMWRYAKELKRPSDNPLLGHEHVPSASALLQSVVIRTNEYGMRGPSIPAGSAGARRVLFLGSSITLGWGVPEEETVTARLERMFSEKGLKVEVLNAGIGNYNAPRYVELFTSRLEALKPTDIVVHYFLRDAEVLDRGGGNFLLRHSQLAVTLWTAVNQYLRPSGTDTLVKHYTAVYDPAAPGYKAMQSALRRLSEYARSNNVRVYLAMVPDVHDLKNYRFGFVHDLMKDNAEKLGFRYIDLLPALKGIAPEQLWAMPGDPHPNALGHRKMADAIFPVISSAK
jgi:lysophospholipase L1-like esterase